jgi:redox-sensitive bicupin YhaK (pirin superfamily)
MTPAGFAFELRRAATRGALNLGWLDARFSFSFGRYDDPRRRRFGPLLALNEDRVQPGTGFDWHPHADLEIVIVPRSGAVEHHDDQGGHQLVVPGQWQWMRAGRGIRHRQWNPSADAADHHFQIWFEPLHRGLSPQVQRHPLAHPGPGHWTSLVAAPGDGAGGLDIGADAGLALGQASPEQPLALPARLGRGLYLHLMSGRVALQGEGMGTLRLEAGDAVVFFDGWPALALQADEASELLRFDVPPVDPATGAARARAASIPVPPPPPQEKP